MKKSKSRRTELQQRAAEILQMLRGAAGKNYRPTAIESKIKLKPINHKADHRKLKNFLKSMHQL